LINNYPNILLGDLVEVMHQGINTAADKVQYSTSGLPIIQSRNFTGGKLIFKDSKFLNEADVKKYKHKYIPKKNDLLFSNIGTVGKSIIVNCNQDFMFAWNVFLIRVDHRKLSVSYLKHYLDHLLLINYYEKWFTGGTVKFLNKKTMAAIQVPLPPLDEQKRIANILDKAYALRQKREKSITLNDNLLRSVFLDMFGDPVENPKKWNIEPLENLTTKICSGSTPKGGKKVYVEKGYLFLRSQNVWRKRLDLDDAAFIDHKTHESMKKTSLKNGDILITKTGRINTENSSLGRAAMFTGEDDSANINGHVYLIRPRPDVINDFILYIMILPEYRDYIRSVCVGGIDKRQINKEHLEKFPIIYPPVEMQQKFIEYLNVVERQKISLKKQLKHADDLFYALTQKAFRGDLTSIKEAA